MSVLTIKEAIAKILSGEDLSEQESRSCIQEIMQGTVSAAQIAGFLIALHGKGECAAEISGAAGVLRELMKPVTLSDPEQQKRLVDTCGTGGDRSGLFNVSTAAAFVCAAGGGLVGKHGNRAVTSSSGSSDVLQAAGARVDLNPEQVARCIETLGVGFIFAPTHHQAMRHVAPVRGELGVRTLFNLIGPLANPARVRRQVLGVFAVNWLEPMARALAALGVDHALVVCSEDGLDEISTAAPTQAIEVIDGALLPRRLTPEDFGCSAAASLKPLRVSYAEESRALIAAAFGAKTASSREEQQAALAADLVAVNAAAALWVGGVVDTLKRGKELADDVIASGQAAEKFATFIDFTNSVPQPSAA